MSNDNPRTYIVHNSGIDLGDSTASVGAIEGEPKVFLEVAFESGHEFRIVIDPGTAQQLASALSVSAGHATEQE